MTPGPSKIVVQTLQEKGRRRRSPEPPKDAQYADHTTPDATASLKVSDRVCNQCYRFARVSKLSPAK